jgi:Uma2 family endonuclease
MYQITPQLMSFEEFLEWHPNDGSIFELINGVPIPRGGRSANEMNPTGEHEEISGFLSGILFAEIGRLNLPYSVPRTATVRPRREGYGHKPDAIICDRALLNVEPDWRRRSTIQNGNTVKLIIEVVSTNWRDDYLTKFADYEELGIPEYWIVDYAGLGGRRFIGNPKQPTLSINILIDGEYQTQIYRDLNQIHSSIFPELKLTANEIFHQRV